MLLEFLKGFGILLGYFIICASSALVVRRFTAIPKEVFRKTLHLIVLCSIFIWIYGFKTWWISAIAAITLAVLIFPVLAFAERIPGYSELLIERGKGEIKRSMLSVFSMFAVLICVCWGWLGEKYLVIASVFAWGLGDAAAALIGKRFGKYYLEGKMIEGRKTHEGTIAMFSFSFVSVLIILLIECPVVWYGCVTIALVTAAACAAVELYTKNGMDTLTCPLAAAAVMIPLILLWGV